MSCPPRPPPRPPPGSFRLWSLCPQNGLAGLDLARTAAAADFLFAFGPDPLLLLFQPPLCPAPRFSSFDALPRPRPPPIVVFRPATATWLCVSQTRMRCLVATSHHRLAQKRRGNNPAHTHTVSRETTSICCAGWMWSAVAGDWACADAPRRPAEHLPLSGGRALGHCALPALLADHHGLGLRVPICGGRSELDLASAARSWGACCCPKRPLRTNCCRSASATLRGCRLLAPGDPCADFDAYEHPPRRRGLGVWLREQGTGAVRAQVRTDKRRRSSSAACRAQAANARDHKRPH